MRGRSCEHTHISTLEQCAAAGRHLASGWGFAALLKGHLRGGCCSFMSLIPPTSFPGDQDSGHSCPKRLTTKKQITDKVEGGRLTAPEHQRPHDSSSGANERLWSYNNCTDWPTNQHYNPLHEGLSDFGSGFVILEHESSKYENIIVCCSIK